MMKKFIEMSTICQINDKITQLQFNLNYVIYY